MIKLVSEYRSFNGWQKVYSHPSDECKCDMEFSIYLPDQVGSGKQPVIWYLSGLTCTWKNAVEKAGFQKYCSELGIIMISPDTSPRGEQVADDPEYDLGQGAGFYLNATAGRWATNFRMYDYISRELPEIIFSEFPSADIERQGITGHSMGGHGSLIFGLRRPEVYKSISCFSPITNPNQVPWGKKAFANYLGAEHSDEYDAVECLRKTNYQGRILIDQGQADSFLESQLSAQSFLNLAKERSVDVEYRLHPQFDHSYYFVASFMPEHINWHFNILKN